MTRSTRLQVALSQVVFLLRVPDPRPLYSLLWLVG